MCGISGLIGHIGPANRAALKRMNDALAHRGPNGDNFWESEADARGWGAMLGHRRLSVLDLSNAASQPMVDPVTGQNFLVTEGDTIDILMTQQITVLQETADSAANPDEAAPPRFEPVTGLEDQRTVKAMLQDKRVIYVSDTKATAPEPW